MGDINIDELLNILGFGRMQMVVFFGCATEQIYVSNEQFGFALVILASSCDFQIDDRRTGWLMFSVFAAQVCCSHYMGYKSDLIGRRKLILITSMLCIVTSFISAFMPDYWSFLVVRTIVSCFLSGPTIAAITYISEFTKISLRPSVLNFACYFIGLSMVIVPATALLLQPLNIHLKIYNNYGLTFWRVLILINLVPGLIAWIIIWLLPESPKYYLSVNKPAEAMKVLEQCCRWNKGKDVTLKSLGVESVSQPNIRSDTTPTGRNCCYIIWYETMPLLRSPYLRKMLRMLSLMFMLFVTGYGLSLWLQRVLEMTKQIEADAILCELVMKWNAEKHISPVLNCHLSTGGLYSSIFHGSCVLVTFMLISLMLLCLNRKTILLTFSTVSAMAGLTLNFAINDIMIAVAFVMFTVPPLCSLRLTLTVIVDVIPTHLRSKAVALAMMFGRVGVMVAHLYLGHVLHLSCLLTFNPFVVAMLVALVLTSYLPK